MFQRKLRVRSVFCLIAKVKKMNSSANNLNVESKFFVPNRAQRPLLVSMQIAYTRDTLGRSNFYTLKKGVFGHTRQ